MTIELLDKPVKLSANQFIWQQRAYEERLKITLMQKFSLPEFIAAILASKEIDLSMVEDFLSPSLKNSLPDPFHLLDMDKAASYLAESVVKQRKIAIFGDYDVDGATSSALLNRFFTALGLETIIYIPDRILEGYGPNSQAFQSLKEQGAEIIITVDCGTMAFEPIALAQEIGLEVIVIDHHLAIEELPAALAVINPNRLDELSDCRYLAAVGVSFLLCVAVKSVLKQQGYFSNHHEPNLLEFLDLVALGTICDVVPLDGVNRAFVKQGLKVLANRNNAGLAALSDIAGINDYPNSYHLGFVLGPRINAGGRVGQASLGANLLVCGDYNQAINIAKILDIHNQERKSIEALVLDEAMRQAEERSQNKACIIVFSDKWHPGVIGIVASRLKDKFNKPVAVIALDGELGKASCRSIYGIDFGAAIVAAKSANLLLAGGGHAMAAGFSIAPNKIAALDEFLHQRFTDSLTKLSADNIKLFDCHISIEALTIDFANLIEKLSPFGSGNAEPKFMITNLRIVNYQIIAGSHIRIIFIDNLSSSRQLRAIAFRAVDSALAQAISSYPKNIDIIGYVRINKWQGNEKVDFIIEDMIF